MLALYYHLKHPTIENFDIRMTEPRSRVYRVVLASKNKEIISFRTGKDWPCYSKIRVSSSQTKFTLGHDHTPVQEEFKIDGKKIYLGNLRTEAGLQINFEGEFNTMKTLEIKQSYRLPSGRSVYKTRNYEIDNKW